MSEYFPLHLQQKINTRIANTSLRSLQPPLTGVDFSSNDYLGLNRNKEYQHVLNAQSAHGSGGSRLLAGNTDAAIKTEKILAQLYNTEAALIYNCGYTANVGLLQSVASRHDTILYDELCHASIIDGTKLALAKSFSFEHNNVRKLEQKLKAATGEVYVVIESVYSMDGDMAPLQEIIELKRKYNFNIIVDEAHATCTHPDYLWGLWQTVDDRKIFARIHTFSKAIALHGAVIVGSQALINYLINYSRAFIYTTAMPAMYYTNIQLAHEYIATHGKTWANQLQKNIKLYRSLFDFETTHTPIQVIQNLPVEHLRAMCNTLAKHNIHLKPILPPTVPAGKERLRITLHAHNTPSELLQFQALIQKII
jgi:8-amino-7-oxononanoate synthase